MPFNSWTLSPKSVKRPTQEIEVFIEECIAILRLLGTCRIVASRDNSASDALSLKLDNIKLRFIIWTKSRQKFSTKNTASGMSTLAQLRLLVSQARKHTITRTTFGLDRFGANDEQVFSRSKLDEVYQSIASEEIHHRRINHEVFPACLWTVVDTIECLNLLSQLDSIVEDLMALSRDDLSMAIETSLASEAIKSMSEVELSSIQASSFSSRNLINQAAEKQLSRLRRTHEKGSSSHNSVPQTLSQLKRKAPASFEDDAEGSGVGSSWAILNSHASEDFLSLPEKFQKLVEKSRDTNKDVLANDYSLDDLAKRRIATELRRADAAPAFTSLSCIDDNLSNLLGIITGPIASPYEGGIFFIRMEIPKRYPFEQPNCRFITKVYHPNIDVIGSVCVESKWSVGYSIWDMLAAIIELLKEPNPESALMADIGKEYLNDKRLFYTKARQMTEEYAIGDWPTSQELSTKIPKQSKPTSYNGHREDEYGGLL